MTRLVFTTIHPVVIGLSFHFIWFITLCIALSLLVLVVGVEAKNVTEEKRIINGTLAAPGRWPFVAAMLRVSSPHSIWCGGTVVNYNTILTAAHCLKDEPKDYILYLGHQNLDSGIDKQYQFTPNKFVRHPDYDWKKISNDLGVIKLNSKINFPKMPLVKQSCLSGSADINNLDTSKCMAVGWGDTERKGNKMPSNLMELNMPVLGNSICAKFSSQFTHNELCAGYINKGKGTCYGDSGSPLFCPFKSNASLYTLFGLTSYGFDCTKANHPSYYTKVVNYLSWIRENTED